MIFTEGVTIKLHRNDSDNKDGIENRMNTKVYLKIRHNSNSVTSVRFSYYWVIHLWFIPSFLRKFSVTLKEDDLYAHLDSTIINILWAHTYTHTNMRPCSHRYPKHSKVNYRYILLLILKRICPKNNILLYNQMALYYLRTLTVILYYLNINFIIKNPASFSKCLYAVCI